MTAFFVYKYRYFIPDINMKEIFCLIDVKLIEVNHTEAYGNRYKHTTHTHPLVASSGSVRCGSFRRTGRDRHHTDSSPRASEFASSGAHGFGSVRVVAAVYMDDPHDCHQSER